MERFLQKSKCSIFHNSFKHMTFQRHQISLLWSKGLKEREIFLSFKRSPHSGKGGQLMNINVRFSGLPLIYVTITAFWVCPHRIINIVVKIRRGYTNEELVLISKRSPYKSEYLYNLLTSRGKAIKCEACRAFYGFFAASLKLCSIFGKLMYIFIYNNFQIWKKRV